MPFPGQAWPLDTKVVASMFHTLALISGVFRSTYRWYIFRFGWDDIWALLALLTDVGCFICSWAQRSVPLHPSRTDIIFNWIAMITLNSVPWEARLSMITSIIRITNPRASIQRTSYAIAIAFGLMWIMMLAQKLYACGTRLCLFQHYVTVSQLITDAVSDALLVAMSIFFLKDVQISRGQRVLLVSSFASSICITILSIAQSVSLFLPISSASLLFAHIKAALSVVICNLLVVVTFSYRLYHKMDIDVGRVEPAQFTSVVPEHPTFDGRYTHSTSLPNPCSDLSQIPGYPTPVMVIHRPTVQ